MAKRLDKASPSKVMTDYGKGVRKRPLAVSVSGRLTKADTRPHLVRSRHTPRNQPVVLSDRRL